MSERIRIRVGALELEWESDDSLPLDNVKMLLKEMEALSPALFAKTPESAGAPGGNNQVEAATGTRDSQKLFVTSIAAKLDAKTGPDLARAAAAHLQMTEGKESFTRQELLEAMKKAPMYYKTSMRKNLSGIIDGLIPNKLNQIGENTYSLTAGEYRAIEVALA